MFVVKSTESEDKENLIDETSEVLKSSSLLKEAAGKLKSFEEIWNELFGNKLEVTREEAFSKFRLLIYPFTHAVFLDEKINSRIDSKITGLERMYIEINLLADALVSWLDHGDGKIKKEYFKRLLTNFKQSTNNRKTYEPKKTAQDIYIIKNISGFVDTYNSLSKNISKCEYAVRKSDDAAFVIEFNSGDGVKQQHVTTTEHTGNFMKYFATKEIGEQEDPILLIKKFLASKNSECGYVPYNSSLPNYKAQEYPEWLRAKNFFPIDWEDVILDLNFSVEQKIREIYKIEKGSFSDNLLHILSSSSRCLLGFNVDEAPNFLKQNTVHYKNVLQITYYREKLYLFGYDSEDGAIVEVYEIVGNIFLEKLKVKSLYNKSLKIQSTKLRKQTNVHYLINYMRENFDYPPLFEKEIFTGLIKVLNDALNF